MSSGQLDLIRIELSIISYGFTDRPTQLFKFESFLNIAEADQAKVVAELIQQDHLTLAFFGDDLSYKYSKMDAHEEIQRQQLADLMAEAQRYWQALPPEQRDLILTKLPSYCTNIIEGHP